MNFSNIRQAGINAIVLFASILTASAGDRALADTNPIAGWIIKGDGSTVLEGKTYGLYNSDQQEFVRYKDRRGANIGWTKDMNGFMKIERQSPSPNTPIKCEEKFGLFVEKEWWMYEKQDYGINISTRGNLRNPDWYQWKFTNCGGSGRAIQTNTLLTLTNTMANMTVVGCERLWGVNLCWTEDIVTFQGKNYRIADVDKLAGSGKVSKEILKVIRR